MQPNLRDINNAGEVVGSVQSHGFLTQFGQAVFIDDPNAGVGGTTQANGVTATATGALVQVVGSYFAAGNNSPFHAYLFKVADGTFFTIDDPLGTMGSQALDINAA